MITARKTKTGWLIYETGEAPVAPTAALEAHLDTEAVAKVGATKDLDGYAFCDLDFNNINTADETQADYTSGVFHYMINGEPQSAIQFKKS